MTVTAAPADSRISVTGDTLHVVFDRFDLDAYRLFLRTKALPEIRLSYDWREDRYELAAPARFAHLLGVHTGPAVGSPIAFAGHLFDYQAWCVEMALEAKRFAVWADTGLGKTAVFLEWARQVVARTGGRVLIFSPLQIIDQTCAEQRRFYPDDPPIERLATRAQLAEFSAGGGAAIGICNYEKLVPGVLDELRSLAGLVADESSILKSGGGVIKWNLIKSAKGIEYKLSCTATPAPNDTMEYASQASFLEKLRTDGEILWTFFTRDKRGDWKVKPHARRPFYRFMASWSIYLRDPAHFGFADILASLPPPEIHEHKIDMTDEQRMAMFDVLGAAGRGMFEDRIGVRERAKLSQIAKGFIYDRGTWEPVTSDKPALVAELAAAETAAGRQTIIWTIFDAESELVEQALAEQGVTDVACLHGRHSDTERAATIARFKTGGAAILVTKAVLVGHGLNFQNARAMIFSGFDDSFERMYQAIRRCYRFGQTDTVHVHVPVIAELEGLMFDNVRAKEARFMADVAIQEKQYRQALAEMGTR